jgi:hypothetical protein
VADVGVSLESKRIAMTHKPVAPECEGCKRIVNHEGENCCANYINPSRWWTYGRRCPMATHITKEMEAQFKLNPLKQSKLSKKGNLRLGYKLKKQGYDGRWAKE